MAFAWFLRRKGFFFTEKRKLIAQHSNLQISQKIVSSVNFNV